MRKTARAADSRDEGGFFRAQIFVAAQALHGGENGVVAAARAPARHAALIVFETMVLVVHLEQAFGGGHRHDFFTFSGFFSFSRITRQIVLGLIGWPFTSLQQSTSIR